MEASDVRAWIDLVVEVVKTASSPQLVVLYVVLIFRRPLLQVVNGLEGKNLSLQWDKMKVIFEAVEGEYDAELRRRVLLRLDPRLIAPDKLEGADIVDEDGNDETPNSLAAELSIISKGIGLPEE